MKIKNSNIVVMEDLMESDAKDQDDGLVLKVVRIGDNQPNSTSPSNSCDNCNPWTSCCDSYS